ncbi:MAG TPA: hypothetical protein PKA59_06660 [Chakrabartia sp.]|jgi:hypothetical protein|nr:hypothetical protein [Chakrabartia sp.]
MKPDISLVLQDHATRLAESIVPKLSGFEANGAAMMSAMLVMIAEEWERGAARRVEENAAIRAIFSQASPLVTDPALSTRIKALSVGRDDDLHISVLDTVNAELRTELTALHAYVEGLDSDAARGVNDAIWAELSASVKRRALSSANF